VIYNAYDSNMFKVDICCFVIMIIRLDLQVFFYLVRLSCEK